MKKIIFAFTIIFLFFSCATLKKEEGPKEYLRVEDYPDAPPLLKILPEIEFSGKGIKYECENMLLSEFAVLHDKEASGLFAARMLRDSSTAKLAVKFPAGTYECLINTKVPDKDHNIFYIYLDDNISKICAETTPFWALTTKTPVYFVVEEEKQIFITICAKTDNDFGNTGFFLDYIQFVKR